MLDNHIAEKMGNIIIDIAEKTSEIHNDLLVALKKIVDLEKRIELLERKNDKV